MRRLGAISGLALGVLGAGVARADERAADVLSQVRSAYRSGAVRERLSIEVRGQAGVSDHSEGRLWLDLAGEGGVALELELGPVRVSCEPPRLVVLHETDPDQYVGVSIESLAFAELERVLPSIPVPQLALALGDADGDVFHLPSLLPPIPLDQVARGNGLATLTGRSGGSAATLIVDLETGGLRRFEASVPASSGWYEVVVTIEAEESVAGEPDAIGTPHVRTLPDLAGRARVGRVADLRPRGLVLVTGADLGWVPIVPADVDQEGPTIGLRAITAARGPLVVGMVEIDVDGMWIEGARRTIEVMDAARNGGESLLLVFDPRGRHSEAWRLARGALEAEGLAGSSVAWVDGRTVSLDRALPRLSPAVVVAGRTGQILDASEVGADALQRLDAGRRLREARRDAP